MTPNKAAAMDWYGKAVLENHGNAPLNLANLYSKYGNQEMAMW